MFVPYRAQSPRHPANALINVDSEVIRDVAKLAQHQVEHGIQHLLLTVRQLLQQLSLG